MFHAVYYYYYNRRTIRALLTIYVRTIGAFRLSQQAALQWKCQIRRNENGPPHTNVCARNVRDKVFRSLNAKERTI